MTFLRADIIIWNHPDHQDEPITCEGVLHKDEIAWAITWPEKIPPFDEITKVIKRGTGEALYLDMDFVDFLDALYGPSED